MKKVIIYGISNIELRRDIEYFLNDNYEVIGYTDTYYTYDALDKKHFFNLMDLCSLQFDYILLCSNRENVLNSMRRTLLELKISPDKIIAPVIFLQHHAEKHQLDLVADIQEHTDEIKGLIFGLSYSLRGICKRMLNIPFYDFSWHGLDLFYNYHLYLYALEHGYFQSTTTALLVFPYYYFNYDMSRSFYQYKTGQIFSVWQLDNWHNFKDVPMGNDYITNYKMFGKKIAQFYRFRRFEILNTAIYQGSDRTEELGNIWFTEHQETLTENREIFSQFVKILHEQKKKIIVVVPPFYLNSLNDASMKVFLNKKKQFYCILQEINAVEHKVEIFDYADTFADCREFFFDTTHLNAYGAKEFTKLINRDILRENM